MYVNKDLLAYCQAVSSTQPIPGGGSVSALTTACSISLLEMVTGLSLGKKGYESFQEEFQSIAKTLKDLKKKALDIVDRDTTCYPRVIEAYRLDKDDPHRQEAIEQALDYAAAVPLELLKTIDKSLVLAEILIEKANQNVVSDAVVAKNLLEASYESALHMMDVNVDLMKDTQRQQWYRSQTKRILNKQE